MLIVDAHQDLAWNMLTFGRDYTRSASETRRLEAGRTGAGALEDTLLGWPDYQRGEVAVVFSTLFASPDRLCADSWDSQCYRTAQDAYRVYRGQLDVYHRLVEDLPSKFRLIRTKGDLHSVLDPWQRNGADPADENPGKPVGLLVLMEGAEGVRHVGELEEWFAGGVRIIGPAWAGTRFCGGSGEPGRLTSEGFALLEGMAGVGFTLDLSHMDETAALQALDVYPGPIIASHSNASALLKDSHSNRHLSQPLIQRLLERGGVIGIVPFNPFLISGWKMGDRRDQVPLLKVIAQIDHICQMAGDALHVGIGSDFDGGFGVQSVPVEIDTVADLQKLGFLLEERGYASADVAAILGGNWLSFLQKNLPVSA